MCCCVLLLLSGEISTVSISSVDEMKVENLSEFAVLPGCVVEMPKIPDIPRLSWPAEARCLRQIFFGDRGMLSRLSLLLS